MQDILVHTENFDPWTPGVEYAAHLAAALGAALTGVYVCPSPMAAMPAYDAPGLLANLLESTHQLNDLAFAAGDSFIELAHRLGARRAAWQVAEGYLPAVLEHIGNWHDLLVLERAANAPWGSAPALGNVVLTTGLPCITVPPGTTAAFGLDCIALAWNGSSEAIRAIHAALPLIMRARRVVLLHGEHRHPFSEIGWRPEFDLRDYLQRHGIHVEEQPLPTSGDEAGEALLDATSKLGADMLVMGAYGRTRFSEWVFGGATRHVLGNASIPVLMRH